MQNVIEVEGLQKAYRLRKQNRGSSTLEAVRGISFQVRRGEIFGILGPNGAGKTTTLEIIEGLKPPTGGSARVLGHDVATESIAVRKKIGVQLQSSSYIKFLTLTELLRLFGSLYAKKIDPTRLLGFVNLQDKADAEVQQADKNNALL
jgi:ABC-2 type transport system ATP-binding protein